MKKLLCIAITLLLALVGAPLASAQTVSPKSEYIVISGGPALMMWEKFKTPPHDIWWMNFIRASRIRIQELIAAGVQPSQITWFVYADAYKTRAAQEGKDLIPTIRSVEEAFGVKLKFFGKTKEVIGYLNNGKPRDQVKIEGLEYFGHSNKACWMFDYSNHIDSASKVWLHEKDFAQINKDIFSRDAFVKSWGCHSGEEMSQKFKSATGLKMWGAVGRTQYNTFTLPTLAKADGRWTH